MIRGIGTDIESVARFRKTARNKHFLGMIFSQREIEYCMRKKEPHICLAGRFCAKEAVIKACHQKLTFKNIEIIRDASDKLRVYVKGKLLRKMHCSISHTEEYATAVAIYENGK